MVGQKSAFFKKLYENKYLWRTERDSNPRDGFPSTHFPGVRLRPLGHLSGARGYKAHAIYVKGACPQSTKTTASPGAPSTTRPPVRRARSRRGPVIRPSPLR